MVRAILEGRKTQTRRLVKNPELFGCFTGDCPHDTQWECDQSIAAFAQANRPYGNPGDRLWVKESLMRGATSGGMHYVEDASQLRAGERWPWKKNVLPSMFMPRWASRITLEITDIGVERLQDITENDALAEGCRRQYPYPRGTEGQPNLVEYAILWDKINGLGSWDRNPWVWKITFKKL